MPALVTVGGVGTEGMAVNLRIRGVWWGCGRRCGCTYVCIFSNVLVVCRRCFSGQGYRYICLDLRLDFVV